MAILESGYAVNIDQVRGPAAVTSHNWVGQRTPLHATSSGKVLLAHAGRDEQERLIRPPLERYTPNTITDAEGLRRELADVRERGYAFTSEPLRLPAGHFGLGHGSGAHAPDEYFVVEPSNPKLADWDGAVASHVAFLHQLAV